MTYEGLESCILNNHSSEKEDELSCAEDDNRSCSSSNAVGSPCADSPHHFYASHKPAYLPHLSDVHSMKEKFSKLLLGDDVTGGTKGVSPAVALSNAVINLAASVFGELWKLEPVPEEAKNRWRKEMDWLLSPTNYIVDLVPAKQCGSNGHVFEIMTPKVRADVHLNLPALRKLDSMLIETLDSMVKTEFWYAEGSNHKAGKEGSVRESKRWWLPYPRVPIRGLSVSARKGLISQGNVVHQVFKAAKSINQNILSEMPVHSVVKAALPKARRESVGQHMYNILADESSPSSQMADSLKLKSDYEALDTINKLEAAQLVWRERILEHETNGKSCSRNSWPFTKDSASDADKIGLLVFKAEFLMQQLHLRHPNLPQSFINATKIQYGKDIGHAIMEAYSRALTNLAYKILVRIGDVLQEDHTNNPTSPVPKASVAGLLSPKWMLSPSGTSHGAKRSLEDGMSSSRVESYFNDSNPSRRSSDLEVSSSRTSSVMNTPSSSWIWCIGGDAFRHGSPYKTP
ncbi:hypothetical protein V2J09_022326 [Rumex salicifolius]